MGITNLITLRIAEIMSLLIIVSVVWESLGFLLKIFKDTTLLFRVRVTVFLFYNIYGPNFVFFSVFNFIWLKGICCVLKNLN